MRKGTVEKEPTAREIGDAFRKTFPQCGLANGELVFLDAIAEARRNGVGFGWMRQAIGIAWKLKDPDGYMDDDRIRELFAPKKRTR